MDGRGDGQHNGRNRMLMPIVVYIADRPVADQHNANIVAWVDFLLNHHYFDDELFDGNVGGGNAFANVNQEDPGNEANDGEHEYDIENDVDNNVENDVDNNVENDVDNNVDNSSNDANDGDHVDAIEENLDNDLINENVDNDATYENVGNGAIDENVDNNDENHGNNSNNENFNNDNHDNSGNDEIARDASIGAQVNEDPLPATKRSNSSKFEWWDEFADCSSDSDNEDTGNSLIKYADAEPLKEDPLLGTSSKYEQDLTDSVGGFDLAANAGAAEETSDKITQPGPSRKKSGEGAAKLFCQPGPPRKRSRKSSKKRPKGDDEDDNPPRKRSREDDEDIDPPGKRSGQDNEDQDLGVTEIFSQPGPSRKRLRDISEDEDLTSAKLSCQPLPACKRSRKDDEDKHTESAEIFSQPGPPRKRSKKSPKENDEDDDPPRKRSREDDEDDDPPKKRSREDGEDEHLEVAEICSQPGPSRKRSREDDEDRDRPEAKIFRSLAEMPMKNTDNDSD